MKTSDKEEALERARSLVAIAQNITMDTNAYTNRQEHMTDLLGVVWDLLNEAIDNKKEAA